MNDVYALRGTGFVKCISQPKWQTIEVVPRTWRQRLFSWPWRPWRAYAVIISL